MRRTAFLAAGLWASGIFIPSVSRAGEETPNKPASVSYMPPSGAFVCDLPNGWAALEEPSIGGMSVHIFGPQRAILRPAYHIHLVLKGTPGFEPIMDGIRHEREGESAAGRETTPLQAWRVSERSARIFEARERRLIPIGALPAENVVLHHFYAFLPAGDDYFIVKLTVSEEEFEDYRVEFRRFLKSLNIIGHK
jgi:hypothetical protein